MGKPRLVIIIRHAQSEGNKDKTIHQHTPDHRVGLTEEGHDQAREAGRKLRQLLRNDDTIHFFISPYRRTRETTEGMLETLCSNEPAPSPFQRSRIKVYEEPRLREQDFGNFQPGGEETERLWRERAAYGHFFYRIPNGESGADVYDRVSSFNGSLWRRFSEDNMASVAILVTHGLCSRVFLMAWYHYSVEFFEDLRNINHCEFLVMKLANSGRYVLQNQLRRWSDLRRERAARKSVSAASPEIPVRKWGSSRTNEQLAGRMETPHGPKRRNTADLFSDSEDEKNTENSRKSESAIIDDTKEEASTPKSSAFKIHTLSPHLEEIKFTDDMHPSDLGRDGGGSKSGVPSPIGPSDDEVVVSPTSTVLEVVPITREAFAPRSMTYALRGELDDNRVLADALGDQSDADVEEYDLEVGTKAREDREMAQILANERRERILKDQH